MQKEHDQKAKAEDILSDKINELQNPSQAIDFVISLIQILARQEPLE